MNDNTLYNVDNNNNNNNINTNEVPKYQATLNANTMLNNGVNIPNTTNVNMNSNSNSDVSVNDMLKDNTNKESIVMPSYNSSQQNIQNITMPEFASNQNFNTNVNDNINNNENLELHDTTSSINDRVIQKKTKKSSLKIDKDMISIFVIAFILLIAIFVVPSIFDLINELKNKISR